jgi:hypothetical protein
VSPSAARRRGALARLSAERALAGIDGEEAPPVGLDPIEILDDARSGLASTDLLGEVDLDSVSGRSRPGSVQLAELQQHEVLSFPPSGTPRQKRPTAKNGYDIARHV